jgi:hypothetical protein
MTTCIEHVRTVRVVNDAYEAVWVGGEVVFPKVCPFYMHSEARTVG